MRQSRLLPLLVILLVALAARAIPARRAEPRPAGGADVAAARLRPGAPTGARELPPGVRRAGFAFGADTAPADRDAFLAAVAGARPSARRLIGLVDGLVDVR